MINDELISINASHSIYVNRLASGLGNKAKPFIEDVNSQIAARLAKETGKNLTPLRREKLLADINEITSTQLKEYTSFLNAENKEFGGYESSWQAKSVNGILVNAETVAVSASVVNKAAKANLIDYGGGSYTTYNQMMRNYWENNTEAITNIVANGYSSGISTREVANQVMAEVGNKLGKTQSQSLQIARTGLTHYGNMASKEYFEANDIIIGTRRVATIDSRTSGFCRSIDRTVVLKSDSGYNGAFSPFHPACRTKNIPEIDARYKQEDDGGERATNFKVDGSLDPKPVDSSKIYYDDLQRLSAKNQDAILGPTLGKAYRKLLRGGGTPAQFAKLTVDDKLNKAYTITELKAQDNVLSRIINEQAK